MRLGIDVGSVRVGVARSDPSGALATPLATIRRGRGDVASIAALVAEHDVAEVIVGLPYSLSGLQGRAAADARGFAAALATRLAPTPVRLFDERFTTVTAHGALRREGSGAPRRRGSGERARRLVVDKAAAAVLLQAALDAERGTGRPPGRLAQVADDSPCEVAR